MRTIEQVQRVWRGVLSASDIAREIRFKMRAEHRSPFAPSWPLPQGIKETVTVRWPARYYDPPACYRWAALLIGMRRHVPVELAELEQPRDLVRFQVIAPNGVADCVVDFLDDRDRIVEEGLRNSTLYFKMQFAEEGYSDDRIVPGGYLTPTYLTYHYIEPLRALKDCCPPRFDVYGRFGTRFSSGDINRGATLRREAVRLLTDQRHFDYAGSLGLVRYSRSLREAAQSRVCIDLPGNGDFCYRLVDYLCLGACVIAPRHRVRLPVPLETGKQIVHTRDDLSDLVDLCQYYVENDEERKRIIAASRDYFDRYLHRDQLAAYYLHTCLQRMPVEGKL